MKTKSDIAKKHFNTFINQQVKEILKENEHVFPKDVIVNFKTPYGVMKVRGRKGTVYYEKKDVLKIIRLLKQK